MLKQIGRVTPEALHKFIHLAHGPCQGTYCLWRCAIHLFRKGVFPYEECCAFLTAALEERWRGNRFVLWGEQARQSELARGIYLQNFYLGNDR